VAGVAVAKGKGALYPNWSPPGSGTFAAPAAELGKLPTSDTVWTQTTISSAIDKPLKAKPISVVGEVVDLSCYLQVGKPGAGARGYGRGAETTGAPPRQADPALRPTL